MICCYVFFLRKRVMNGMCSLKVLNLTISESKFLFRNLLSIHVVKWTSFKMFFKQNLTLQFYQLVRAKASNPLNVSCVPV